MAAPSSTKLGNKKIWWIMTQAPPQRHAVFLQRGMSPNVTSGRVESIHESLVAMNLPGMPPPVIETYMDSGDWWGEDVDGVWAGFIKTRPSAPATRSPRVDQRQRQLVSWRC